MQSYELSHLTDAALLHDLEALVAHDRAGTATLLAHLAEVDTRRLHVPMGYPSMFAYCVDKLHFSEDAAYKRITSARAGRKFPALLHAIADGRLHLSAVSMLAPRITPENEAELILAATHRRRANIEEFLARRFASATVSRDLVPVIRPLPRPAPGRDSGPLFAGACELVPETDGASGNDRNPDRGADGADDPQCEGGSHRAEDSQLAPGRVDPRLEDGGFAAQVPGARTDIPPSEEKFLVQVAISRGTYEKLRHLQSLLSHTIPAGDLAQVLDRALDALITQIEKRKLGAASRGADRNGADEGHGPGGSPVPEQRRARRHIPAAVRRAVWERDHGQCTFVSPTGQRCAARSLLEFDHVLPVARGGKAAVETIRLRCRAHNQYEAERAFGVEFMRRKREEARRTEVDIPMRR